MGLAQGLLEGLMLLWSTWAVERCPKIRPFLSFSGSNPWFSITSVTHWWPSGSTRASCIFKSWSSEMSALGEKNETAKVLASTLARTILAHLVGIRVALIRWTILWSISRLERFLNGYLTSRKLFNALSIWLPAHPSLQVIGGSISIQGKKCKRQVRLNISAQQQINRCFSLYLYSCTDGVVSSF